MSTAKAFTKTGSKSQASKLDKSIFGLKVEDNTLLKQAYLYAQAKKRDNYAKTKIRSEVRGGGKKPWRQKGTGRARAGSIRSPIWRGGGITFGPTGRENYEKNLSKKARAQALRQALSLKSDAEAINVISGVEIKDGKTKTAKQLLDKLGLNRGVLLVASLTDEQARAFRNLDFVTVVSPKYLNAANVLDAHSLLFSKEALDEVTEWLGGSK